MVTSTAAVEASTTAVFLGSAVATIILGTALAYTLLKSSKSRKDEDIPDSSACSFNEDDTTPNIDTEAYPGGYLTIIYGSQTGTAAGFAQKLCDECPNHGFRGRLVDMEDVTCSDDIDSKFIHKTLQDANGKARMIVLAATYGEGECTDSSIEIIRLLKDQTSTTTISLSNLEYCVFGLGNRQYEHYNAMGKFFDHTFETLGGTRIFELGLGDDDQDLESDFDTWKDKMWMELTKRYSPTFHDTIITAHGSNPIVEQQQQQQSPYKVEYMPELHGMTNIGPDVVPLDHVNKQTKHYFTAVDCPVSVVRELRSKRDGGSTLHIELDVSSCKDEIQYETAANLAILPVNSISIVNLVAKALSFDLDAVFRLKPSMTNENNFQHLFPSPCSVRECLSRYCDLTTPPRRSELSALANYATNSLDKKALQRLASKEGRDEYRSKILDSHTGIADIVSTLCPSIVIPLEHFIHVCTRLQPRFYTISSSSSLHPHSVHLTVSIMRGENGNGEWLGVCSGHLSNIFSTNIADVGSNNRSCRIFVRSSSFRLPSDSTKPIIMVGPGTGIAPMRAFLQERLYQKQQENLVVGENVLYFGCRRRDSDFLYEEELKQFQEQGILTRFRVAFSREEDRKVYVQHLLAENGKETWDLIDGKQASIYVCGGTKMGMDVTDAITKLIADVGGKGKDGAMEYVNSLRSEGRFVQELWA